MAFGVLFDFTGNSNVSQVTKASTLVTQQWFLDAINYTKPIDMYIVAGHNPIRTNASTSTFGTIYKAIRNINKHAPIQFFGGHTHIRDFFVYDNVSTGLESGTSLSQSTQSLRHFLTPIVANRVRALLRIVRMAIHRRH
jgi:hypothetical protein